MTVRLGVDTGGTFSDFVLVDEEAGVLRRAKVPSTPGDPARAVRAGLEELGISGDASQVTVGTTIATNAVLERRGPKVAYVGNRGFTDIPFIGRLDKERLYDLHWRKPSPLVRRRDCVGVGGRVDHHGDEIEPLAEADLGELADALAELESADEELVVAVCLLFSYLTPDHERRVREAVERALPDAAVSVSHEVSPVWREYERASTTIADAFVKPIVGDYVDQVGAELDRALSADSWNLLASNGGFLSSDAARGRPAQLLLSGLAGGVTGARHFAAAAGVSSAFTLDMGGTSCDIGVIADGVERYAPEFDVAWGIPATIPCVSVETIGAGGGSIAWIDKGGLLRVGPQSAGAEPGPVAYDRGGEVPTLTDANLVLGRLSPDYFLGGRMALDRNAAVGAYEALGGTLGLDAVATARAALKIADEEMANAIRLVGVEGGLDPREFALTAFGGAGPLHARSVASRLGITTILVPPAPGLCSAFGALIAPPRVDRAQTYYARSETLDEPALLAAVEELSRAALSDLRLSVATGESRVERFASLRYAGQNFELEVPVDVDGGWPALRQGFDAEHGRKYGFELPGEPVEVINLRATAIAARAELPSHREPAEDSREPTSRPVWLDAGEAVDCPVHRRAALDLGAVVAGPAVIEEPDSTTILLPGDRAEVDASGALLISLEGDS